LKWIRSNGKRKWNERFIVEELKRIYRANNEESAKEGVLKLKERWGKVSPGVVNNFVSPSHNKI
jgi:transposase-like protein